MSEPFIAEIRMFTYTFAPRSWAYCDGQLLPISQNTALFSLIGTTYGGDGQTTFALPNLQGRVPMHPGRGPGLTQRRLGESVGQPTVSLTESEIPAHTHRLRASQALGTSTSPSGEYAAAYGGNRVYADEPQNLVQMSPAALQTSGAGNEHENRQPYLVVSFCIALQGLYPSRS
jgi:microcystin-dependent protein